MAGPFEIRFDSYSYDSTFGVEHRSEVALRGDGAGSLEYRITPIEVPSDSHNPAKLTADGVPYEIRTERAGSWIYTPDLVVAADHSARTTVELGRNIDPNGWFSGIVNPPPMMTLNMAVDDDELKQDYQWEIVGRMEQGLLIQGVPREERLAWEFSSVEFILDEATWLPYACRFVQSANEQVLVVKERSFSTDFDAERAIEAVAGYAVIERQSAVRLAPPESPEPTVLSQTMDAALFVSRLTQHPLATLLELVADAYDTMRQVRQRIDQLITRHGPQARRHREHQSPGRVVSVRAAADAA
jgi:hypothetical protein